MNVATDRTLSMATKVRLLIADSVGKIFKGTCYGCAYENQGR